MLPPRLRVLIVDDHPVMRDGLKAAIDQESDLCVVGEAGDGGEALTVYRSVHPDVVLMDLQMPGVDGLQAIEAIRAEHPAAAIIVLTTYPGDARVKRAMALGAISYLLKTSDRAEILRAVRLAAEGRHVVAPEAAQQVAAHLGSEDLSSREISTLRLVAAGHANKAIADRLHLSEDTVKARLKVIFAKLGAHDRTHAVTIAMQRGFIDG